MGTVKGNPSCRDCSLYENAQAVCLMGRGKIPSKIMLIGEAPGLREDDIGKPFSGPAGDLVDKMLKEVNVTRDELYITNVCKCRPPDNRTPTKPEMKACAKYLEREFEEVKPGYILLLGATPLKSLLNKAKITEIHGEIFQENGIYYMPTFHPAAALRDPQKLEPLRIDFERFFELVRRGNVYDFPQTNISVVHGFDDFNDLLDDIKDSRAISFDLETNTLNRFEPDSRINCLGIGTSLVQWVLPLDFEGSPFKDQKKTQQLMIELIAEAMEGKHIIAHNGKFDNLFLRHKYGIRFPLSFDTMMASHLLDENTPNGLKYLARLYFKAPNYDLTKSEKQGQISASRYYKYCAYDVYYTLRLYYLFRKKLRGDPALKKIFKHLTMPAFQAFEDIEENGVYVNVSQMEEVERELRRKVGQKLRQLNRIAGEEINWNSSQQVARILFEKWKLDPVEETQTGFSTKESILISLRNQHEGIPLLLEYRAYQKALSSFIEGWKKRMVNGKLHPSFKLHGTVTGRPSCTDPNLQQVPRDAQIRSLIGAPPGWTFVQADYSQIELRVGAMLANERTMKFIFQTRGDIHIETAKSITGLNEVDKDQRKKAKAINFGLIYGMGAPKLKEYAGEKYGVDLSLGEAKSYRDRYFDKYGDLLAWHEKQRRLVRNFGEVRSPLGRLRRLPGIYSPDRRVSGEAERQAINAPVQGFASDITQMSLVEIWKKFPRDKLKIVGSVHDSILMMIKNEYLDKFAPKILKIMENPELLDVFGVQPTVPLTVDIEVGDWGAGVPWENKKKKP